jgi:hypothetical protein
MSRSAASLPSRDRAELLLGRTLAFCVHPVAAWPVLSKPWRALILTAYAAAGYILTFGALKVAS